MIDVIHALELAVAPEQSFDVFTDGLGTWWPQEYTWSGDTLAEIGIERGAGGFCYEFGPHGFRCDWGRVLVWDPPRRLVLTWQIGPHREPVPDPGRAGEVEVRFGEANHGRTLFTLEQRHFERFGKGGQAYAEAMGSPQGWPLILDRFAAACAQARENPQLTISPS